MVIQKLEVLRTLINKRGSTDLQRAESSGFDGYSADAQRAQSALYPGNPRTRLGRRKGAVPADEGADPSGTSSMTKLINKEITWHISISDKDVTETL